VSNFQTIEYTTLYESFGALSISQKAFSKENNKHRKTKSIDSRLQINHYLYYFCLKISNVISDNIYQFANRIGTYVGMLTFPDKLIFVLLYATFNIIDVTNKT